MYKKSFYLLMGLVDRLVRKKYIKKLKFTLGAITLRFTLFGVFTSAEI